MKIVCLLKQVPRGDAIRFDEETKSLVREGVPLELNRFDAYALAHAVRLGGEVVAMTMGPPQAEEALRTGLALGADRAVHLSDRAFALADTLGTSRALAHAIRAEGPDLVLCGRKTTDSETWQVPAEVAAFLELPQVTNAVELEPAGGKVRVRRLGDDGEESYELELPGLCSVALPPKGADVDVEPLPAPDAIERIVIRTATDLGGDERLFGQRGSPTRVLAVRDVTPERAHELFTDPEEAAARVRELLAERPPAATAWEKPERLGETPGHSYDCWSVVELVEGRPARISLELLAKGRELSGKLGGRNVALLLGQGLDGAAREAVRHGAEVVVSVDDDRLAEYEPELWAGALAQVLERERPHALLIPATSRGRDYGPRAAGALELGMTGDCVDLAIDRAGRLIQFKPAYGGNIVSVIMGATTPQLATVRARMFEPLEPSDAAEGEQRRFELGPLPAARTRLLERDERERAFDLDEAKVVVSAGAGLGDTGAVEELRELAAPLGAALGGDRRACEAGLVARSRQLGLLGRSVAPRLYVAVETESDFEHAVASVKASVIVVFEQSETPVEGTADVAIAGDWRETFPPFAALLADVF
ncbi:MAG TPA: FAD-binding protein [Gaiellaceae bacterium]|nr:FAD-binding protein [Gaiellaceae bacterium]HYA09424.1 FAD-binding protein [Gaiellaceae bacterium]